MRKYYVTFKAKGCNSREVEADGYDVSDGGIVFFKLPTTGFIRKQNKDFFSAETVERIWEIDDK